MLCVQHSAGCFTGDREKQIMCTPFPMIKDKEKLTISHNKIYSDIVSELEAGKNVAMLTIGDTSVYSTYMYIHKRVMQAGFRQ